ncbi:MAG: hypothetical protein ABIR11_08960, partial [Candidatus Limnocylindrales bacterium]
PSTAVAVPVERGGVGTPVVGAGPTPAERLPGQERSGSGDSSRPRDQASPGGSTTTAVATATRTGMVAVLDPVSPLTPEERARAATLVAPVLATPVVASIDIGPTPPGVAIRPRPPVTHGRPSLGLNVIAMGTLPARSRRSDDAPVGGPAAMDVTSVDPCGAPRRLVEERCALATVARDQARTVADQLREAQRAYDVLRERIERAQAVADRRELAAARDELHRQFRLASEAAGSTDDAEAAARDWLGAINDLNGRARDAARLVESGGAELRAALPALERLSLEADAARISAEGADAGCHDAREGLATCEEAAAVAAAAVPQPAPAAHGPHPFDALWPGETEGTHHEPLPPPAHVPASGQPLVLRMLKGDRAARDRLVASLATADADPDAVAAWQLRLTGLMDAIVARAIEDGYLDLPDHDPFWGMFEQRERREIIGALSALGYRFDGLRGFADDRVPAARDLSLAVGYAGLDRMRVRAWPREAELATLFADATVAADEWLIELADDLSLGRMVDALGTRAAELADVWNAWGRLRPALLSAG